MKLSTPIAAALTVLASTANARLINSKPFYLVLESSNAKLDGTALGTCHEGAAIESLCKGVPISQSNPKYTTFKFQQQAPASNYGQITFLEDKQTHGKHLTPTKTDFALTYAIDVEPLGFYNHPGSNVALPLFGLGEVQDFSFDGQERLYIDPSDANNKKLYRWYMCRQKFEGYTYDVLSWVYGTDAPDNKSCQKVNVKRVFK